MEPTLRSNLFQFGFGVAASLSIAAAGAWLAWPSAVIPMIKENGIPINMTGSEISTMVALMDLGNVLSPIPASYSMNWIGRKLTLMTAGLCALVASFSMMFATSRDLIWLIYTGRIFAGLTKGVAYAVLPIYMAEIANTKVRGGLSALAIAFLTLGSLFDYSIGPYCGYNALNITNIVIPILFLVSTAFFPESPYFLIMNGKEDKALTSLSKFRQAEKSKRKENGLEKEYSEIIRKVNDDMKSKARFIDLVSTPSNRRALLIISLLAFFQRSSGVSPIIAYSTTTMPKEGGGLSSSDYMIVFSIIHTLATYGATPLVDNWGRKPLMMFSSFTTAITTTAYGVYYYLERNGYETAHIQWIPYACLVIFAFTYGIGIGFIPSTLVGELFPTNVKSYAGSVSAMILAIVSFVINKIFQAVTDNYGAHYMFWYFSLASFACTAFVYKYMFETKGKTFAEIQDYMINLDRKN